MKLITKIPLKPITKNTITYNSKIVLFGSCFSEHISEKLAYHKFQVYSNPFGILFHPKAIENLIEKAVSGYVYDKNDVFKFNEQFQCFDAHSKLNTLDEAFLVTKLNSGLMQTNQQLKKASHIVITLGTAWVYKHIRSNKIVANCHKVPQKEFEKSVLSTEEIATSLQKSIDAILSINPDTQFIFTLSPVRHIKDGFTQNSLSKALLLVAVHDIIAKNNNTHYFPSFEIMMDELRDYRFYNEDLLHPNTTAINSIWDRFTNVWFNAQTVQTATEIAEIQKSRNHKPFNPDSKAHQAFLLQLKEKEKAIDDKFPHIEF